MKRIMALFLAGVLAVVLMHIVQRLHATRFSVAPAGTVAAPAPASQKLPRIRLRGPVALPGSDQGLILTLQVGENRFYRYNNLRGAAEIDLGALERGQHSFRMVDIELYSMSKDGDPRLWKSAPPCTGGFDVDRDHTLSLTIRSQGNATVCELR